MIRLFRDERLGEGETHESSYCSIGSGLDEKALGRTYRSLPVLFLLFDGVIHVMKPAPVVQAFAQLGYPDSLAIPLGIIEFFCVAVYVLPRTSVLGAVLLTGYLGGAVASHLRVGDSLFGQVLFPVYVGVLLWGGLFLRDGRLRTVFHAKTVTASLGSSPVAASESQPSSSRTTSKNALRWTS